MSRARVETEGILKELRALWRDLGSQTPDGVLRACAMTLIVVADEARDAQMLGEKLAALMHEHPSRAILVRVRCCQERVLESRVYAQCWTPFGRRQQICCEQVEIVCSPVALADVAAMVRGLTAPDLPVILYCPSENIWPLPQFESMLAVSGKLIVDSCGMRGSTDVLPFLRSAAVDRRADLVWSRLTPWREAVASLFNGTERSRGIYELTEIRMLYKAEDEPSAVYYLAGWFMHVLGAGVKLKIARGVGPEVAGIADVRLVAPEWEASVSIVDRCTAETRIGEGAPQATVFPVADEYYALRQELAIAGRDPVFEDALGLANLMRGAA